MNRLNQLRSEAGGSRDSSIDTSTTPSEAYLTPNESGSKYYSLSEDSSFDVSPIKSKDVSLDSAAHNPEKPVAGGSSSDQLISNLSPIPKQNDLHDFKFGKQIEAANILSGGVNIFDDNENSYDGNELVIDDNVVDIDDKVNLELHEAESSELSFQKIDEAADNEAEPADVANKDTEIVLQIDGKNVNAINIGNGLYLYRKEGQEELAAVQIMDDCQPQPSFKFLKVRENAEGNLEVYEEIEIEVPKDAPVKEVKNIEKNISYVPEKVAAEPAASTAEAQTLAPSAEAAAITQSIECLAKEVTIDVNLNSKLSKVNETRKSPVIHSTPNKEGIPLTKTMVDQQLHPHRHLDKVKTIEVHTDFTKQKLVDSPTKNKDSESITQKLPETVVIPTKLELNIETPMQKSTSENMTRENKKSTAQSTNCKHQRPQEPKNFEQHLQKSSEKLSQDAEESGTKNNQQEAKILTEPKISVSSGSVQDKDQPEANAVAKSDKFEIVLQLPVSKKVFVFKKEEEATKVKPEAKNELGSSNKANIELEITEKDKSMEKITIENDVSAIQIKSNDLKEAIKEGQIVDCTKADLVTPVTNKTGIILPKNIKDDKNIMSQSQIQIGEAILEKLEQLEKDNIGNLKEDVLLNANNLIVDSSNFSFPKPSQKCLLKEISTEAHTLKPEIKEQSFESKSSINKHKVITCEPLLHTGTVSETTINADTNKSERKVTPNNVVQPKSETGLGISSITSKETRPEQKIRMEHKKNIPIYTPVGYRPPLIGPVGVLQKSEVTTASSQIVTKVRPVKDTPPLVESALVAKREVSKPVQDQKPVTPRVMPKSNIMPVIVRSLPDSKTSIKKETCIVGSNLRQVNNNYAAVPFGKWTEANRQEFLNKIKESKVPCTTTNTKQIKQPNDLNKREFLQKIDIHRNATSNTTVKTNEQVTAQRLKPKPDSKTFINKPIEIKDPKVSVKHEQTAAKTNVLVSKPDKMVKPEVTKQPSTSTTPVASASNQDSNQDGHQIRNNQDLIDKTIEGIINRVITGRSEDSKHNLINERTKDVLTTSCRDPGESIDNPVSLDAIEMQMNELHGIPFVERPPHQLPKTHNLDIKTYSKADNLKTTSQAEVLNDSSQKKKPLHKDIKENVLDIDSEEEIIEHQPITGDIDLSKKCIVPKVQSKTPVDIIPITEEAPKNEAVITETDFEKFARRNSITYENKLTVKFDGNEAHNVVQTVGEKELPQAKKYSRNELLLAEAKVKSDQKQLNRINHPNKAYALPKLSTNDDTNKSYQSKVQMAYNSAMTAKRKIEPPVTIIEDKPVKVMFIDTHTEFVPSYLNAQGKQLSPQKKSMPESDALTISTGNSLDTDVMDSTHANKSPDDNKAKGKHQRKQVLTPVEAPELELIEPCDLGVSSSSNKKRRTEEDSIDKSSNNVVPKKSYLLGRNKVTEEIEYTPQDLSKTKTLRIDQVIQNTLAAHKDTASAIDNLVKAAELLETQSENVNTSTNSMNSEEGQATPAKRGRGRPRKYPLGEGPQDKNKIPSPHKRPRLTDTKPKDSSVTDDDTSDEDIVRENWTMGKINDKIVCPICKKLFRSENVVFKHVKHCTGPSPNRSESDKVSRRSQESDTKSVESKGEDVDYEPPELKKTTPKKRISKEIRHESSKDTDDVIVIEDTPKENPSHESRISSKTKVLTEGPLSCDVCGKTFRQLSYLINHKRLHKKEESKHVDYSTHATSKSVFPCEICKKEFRKLHHLVQHRLIHNPNMSNKISRKSSSEQVESKKFQSSTKPVDDPSAAFRCEPCDKSFRKLHHLVEHRETHDGQNKQKTVEIRDAHDDESKQKPVEYRETVRPSGDGQDKPKAAQAMDAPENKTMPEPPPRCDICNKTFRKLHHLIEHKEQHIETSSEKSDDKSVKSSLSTKDIIHECRLCYMVFPNEHSLNKHSVFCQKKKKPAPAQPTKPNEEVPVAERDDVKKPDEKEALLDVSKVTKEVLEVKAIEKNLLPPTPPKLNPYVNTVIEAPKTSITEPVVPPLALTDTKATNKKELEVVAVDKVHEVAPEVSAKIKKINSKTKDVPHKLVPRKKIQVKEKNALLIEKRHRVSKVTILPDVTFPESSDDDEVRYMLNPDHKTDKSELFMAVRAKKRSSLDMDKPLSDSVKRRASMQDSPKTLRRKSKSADTKVVPPKTTVTKNFSKVVPVPSTEIQRRKSKSSETNVVPVVLPKTTIAKKNPKVVPVPSIETQLRKSKSADTKVVTSKTAMTKNFPKVVTVPSTDSDDSDVKYSFPETIAEEQAQVAIETKKALPVKRKSLTAMRKSLTGIAKMKNPTTKVHKEKMKTPTTSLMHQEKTKTPVTERIIKRRTLGVEHRCDCGELFNSAALLSRHTSLAHTPPRIRKRRSPPPSPQPTTPKTNATTKQTRKSAGKTEKTPKLAKNNTKSADKPKAAHRGVPVPEKMKNIRLLGSSLLNKKC